MNHTSSTAAAVPELVVHNLPQQAVIVDDLPEFSAQRQILLVDPTSCSARCCATIIQTEQSCGKHMLRTRLAHSLRLQMNAKFFSVWWCVASDVPTLERCLLDWADALDPSGSLSMWTSADALRVLQAYPEQQRVWGKCCVLVLDECTNATLHFFINHWCSRWGIHLVVLGQEVIEMAALQQLVPESIRADLPSVLPLGDEDASAFSQTELSTTQFQSLVVPQFLDWIDDVRESGDGEENDEDEYCNDGTNSDATGNATHDEVEDDEENSSTRQRHDASYMNKAAAILGFRPVLLRFCAVLMQLKPSMDTYNMFHSLQAAATTEEAQAGDYRKAAVRLVRNEFWQTGGDFREEDGIWFDAFAVMPFLFPASVVPHERRRVVDLYIRLGVVTTLSSPAPVASAGNSSRLLKISSWFRRILLELLSVDQLTAASSAVVMRCTELASQFPQADNVRYHNQHERLLLEAATSSSSCSVLKQYAAGFSADKRAESIQFGLLHTSNPFLAKLRRAASTSQAGTGAEKSWQRWGRVVVSAVSSIVLSRRLSLEVPVIFPPPVDRPFRDLVGVPPLPSDVSRLTPDLAQTFRLYAKAHAAGNDFVSAAAAVERALCIYIGIFDDQAQAASAKFAELLMPRIQDPQMLRGATMTRRQSTLHQDASQHGSSLQRKMSRAGGQMGPGNGGGGSGLTDGIAYSHCFSLIGLLVEDCYHEASAYYVAAGMAGIAESLVHRCVAMLELLNSSRRDTPARAISSTRRAEILLALGQMEEKRGSTIKHADYLDEDTSDMKLRERVKADVESRTYFRKAAAEASEALAAIGRFKDDYLMLDLVSYCERIVARQQLVDYEELGGLQHAEISLEISKIKLEKAPADPPGQLGEMKQTLSLQEIVNWTLQNAGCFVRAIQLGEYSLAHEMLDRTPLLAVVGYLDGFEAVPGSLPQVLAVESEAADMLCEFSFPTPQLVDHLHLVTTFSGVEIASHHGRCWQKKPRIYCLPAHQLLLCCGADDDAAILLLHRILSLGYDPRSCSPHDMKTLLHIAVDRNLHAATQCLLKHKFGDVLYTAQYMLASQRIGLSTVPVVSRVANPLPGALFTCRKNCQLLLVLLYESNSPQCVFDAGKVFIVEELAADRESSSNLRLVLGKGAPFEASLSSLLEEPAIAIETKQELAKLCSFRQIDIALAKANDPYFITVLCDRIVAASPSNEEVTRVLVAVATRIVRSAAALTDGGTFEALVALLKKYPKHLSEETLYWDDVKTVERRTGMRLAALQAS